MKITSKDVIWSYTGMIMKVGINIFLFPMVLGFLSSEEIGMWTVFSSISGIVVLFDFGFAATLARNVAYAWSGATELSKQDVHIVDETNSNKNADLLKITFSTCKYIYLIISLLALFFMLTFGMNHVKSIGVGENERIYAYSWLIYSLAIFVNLYYGYFTSFLYGVGAVAENNKAGVISKTFQLLLSFMLLKMGYGLISLSIAYLVSGIILRVLSRYYFIRYENVRELLESNSKKIDFIKIKSTFLTIWYNAWRDGLVSLTNYIMLQSNVLVLSYFVDLKDTGIYGISLQLVNIIGNIALTFYGTYQPLLQQAHVKNDLDESRRIFSLANIIFVILFISMSLGLVIIGVPIIKWIKPEMNLSIPLLVAMCIFLFLYRYNNMFTSYISNTNNVPYVKAYIVSATLSMLFSIILLKTTDLGVWAFLLSGVCVNICYNSWKWPSYVLKNLNLSYRKLTKLGVIELKKNIGEILK